MDIKREDINFLQDPALIQSDMIFNGNILQLYVNQLKLENGQIVNREILHHQPATAILAITPEDKVLLVKQYRPAIVESIFEIPAGILDYLEDGTEDALTGAVRELEEETGYRANQWERLVNFYVTPGYLNEEIILYYATDLVKVDHPLPQDEDEDVSLFEFTRSEVTAMMEAGEIKDLKTLYALQYWLNQKPTA